MRTFSLAAAVALLMMTPACRRADEARLAPSAPDAQPAPPPSTPTAAASASAAFGSPGGTLGTRLDYEREHRPKGAPRAEAVLDAIDKSGVALSERKQHLGGPVGAGFCMGALSTPHGLSMSVCEYPDAAAAEKGKSVSTEAFKAIANRDVYVHGNAVLMVLQDPRNADSEAAAKKAVDAFNRL